MGRKRTIPFVCFYCGLPKEPEESSGEHIVPSSIGGTRNATFTDEVCADCNSYMDTHVDVVFSRDFFIESARFLAGIRHRGKDPILKMGRIGWDRPEKLTLFITKENAAILLVDGAPDGHQRLMLGIEPDDVAMREATMSVVNARFRGVPVINDAIFAGRDYEDSLFNAARSLSPGQMVTNDIRIDAWHRELVKIALGLACMYLGEVFTTSGDAALLRDFLFEDDPDKRLAVGLKGVVGIGGADVQPDVTAMWHPGDEQSLFALVGLEQGLVFVANLFGKYENWLLVGSQEAYHHLLPQGGLPGVAWLVDGKAKSTSGPSPIGEFFVP